MFDIATNALDHIVSSAGSDDLCKRDITSDGEYLYTSGDTIPFQKIKMSDWNRPPYWTSGHPPSTLNPRGLSYSNGYVYIAQYTGAAYIKRFNVATESFEDHVGTGSWGQTDGDFSVATVKASVISVGSTGKVGFSWRFDHKIRQFEVGYMSKHCSDCPPNSVRPAGDDPNSGAAETCICDVGFVNNAGTCTQCPDDSSNAGGDDPCVCNDGFEGDGTDCNVCPANSNAVGGWIYQGLRLGIGSVC